MKAPYTADRSLIRDGSGERVADCIRGWHPTDEQIAQARASAKRIAACLNALDGIEDPAAALAEVRRLCAAATFGIGTDPGKAMLAQKILSLLGAPK